MFDVLSKSPVFKGINSYDLENLFSNIFYKKKKFSKENMVALSDEECKNLIIVISGSVRGEMIDFSGKVVKIEDIEAPRPIALAFLFGMNNRYPVNVVANDECELVFIPKESVVDLLQSNVIVLNNFLNSVSSRTQFLSDKIKFLTFKTIKAKIAHFILKQAKDNNTVTLNKTQQQLADLFGVARPSLARSLSEMEKDGLISVDRKVIEILDKRELIDLMQ